MLPHLVGFANEFRSPGVKCRLSAFVVVVLLPWAFQQKTPPAVFAVPVFFRFLHLFLCVMNRFVQNAFVTESEYTDSVYTCQVESTKSVSQEKNKNPVHVDLGSKLWKFQQELGLTQEILGKKFSTVRADEWRREYSKRMIQGYESGENELSSELLYNIWKAGYSIDDIFAERAQSLKDSDHLTDQEADARAKDVTIRSGNADFFSKTEPLPTGKVSTKGERVAKPRSVKKR